MQPTSSRANSVAEAIEAIRGDPCVLDRLPPMLFEEIVAELLASFGWQISLSRFTAERGYDILGISQDATGFETSWVVECKRFSREHRIGVAVVRQLLGTKMSVGISHGLLVTSSFLTQGARTFVESADGLHIADRDTLLAWVARYAPKAGAYLPRQQFSSCFVSYSHLDEEFVRFLVARLRAAGVRVWFAPEDLVGGRKLHEEITAAINRFDRLVIVLSNNSMKSEWVRSEIRNARQRELKEERRVLFPVSLAPFDVIKSWQLFDADIGQDLATELREYYIPDFTRWKDLRTFEDQFAKVIAGLQAS